MNFVKIWLYLSLFICLLSAAIDPVDGESRTQNNKSLSPHHGALLREVTEIAISPDGKHIAYVLRVPRKLPQEKNGVAWQEVHIVTADGESRSYLSGQFRASNISWTPDGRGISFLAKKPGKSRRKSVYLIPVNGGQAKRILTHETDIKDYSWSPSGKQIAFLATEKLSNKQQKLKKLGFNQKVFREDWRSVKVWLSNLEKNSKPQVLELPGSASELHWGPMGTKLAVALAPTSLVDDSYTSRKVRIIDVKSRRIIQRINNVGKLDQIVWSPDGTRLGIIGSVNERDPEAGRIQVAKANQSRLEDVLPDYLGHVQKIDWFDRENIIYLGDEGVKMVIGQISINDKTSIISIDSDKLILRDLSISKERKAIASICSSPTHPREVCYWNSKNRKIVRLTTGQSHLILRL